MEGNYFKEVFSSLKNYSKHINIYQTKIRISNFVRDGIYNSVADYNLTWRVSSVCLCVCLCVCVSRGKLCYWVTFERFELEG